MSTNIKHFSELSSILGDKNTMCKEFIRLMGLFSFARSLSHLKCEKEKGAKVSDLIQCLLLFRLCGMNVYQSYKERFMSLIDGSKNQFYRLLVRPEMNWRQLLLYICKTFFLIVEKNSEDKLTGQRYYILDDTTIPKTGLTIEGISKVYDHVFNRYVLGYKCQILAVTDKVSTLIADFSLHSEPRDTKTYGLTKKQLKNRTVIKRKDGDCMKTRVEELDMPKRKVALEMIKRTYKYGIKATCLLMDKWYFGYDFIKSVRKIAKGAIHVITLLSNKKTTFTVEGKKYSAKTLMSKNANKMHSCRKYKSRYAIIDATYVDIPVRLFLVKYGHATDFEVIVSTDTSLDFISALESYQIRWSIEVINKECKQYLGLGKQQSTNMNAQIADTTIVFIGYNILTLGKRFSDYETLGGLFHDIQKETLELTFFERNLPLIVNLIAKVAELFNASLDDVIERAMLDVNYNRELLLVIQNCQDVKERRG